MAQGHIPCGIAYSKNGQESFMFSKDIQDGHVDMPGGMKSIGYCSFYSYDIESITFPDGLWEIGDFVFDECSIKTARLPASMKKIGKWNFVYAEDIWLQSGRPIPGLFDSFLHLNCFTANYKCGQPFVRIHIEGKTIVCPKYAEGDKIQSFVAGWDAGHLDFMAAKYLYRAATDSAHSQDAALAALELCPDDVGIMVNVYASFVESAERYIKAGSDNELMKLLRLCPMPEGAADELIRAADGCGNDTAKAYILEAAEKRRGQGDQENMLEL